MIPDKLKVLLDECKWDEALAFTLQGEDPISGELLEKQAWCYSRTERYGEAIAIYKDLLQKQPDKALWHYSLGYQYYAQKDYATSVSHFEKALEYYPNYFKVKYRIAYALFQVSGVDNPWTKADFWKAVQHLEDCHSIYASYNDEQKEKNKSTYADICALHGKSIVNSKNYLDKAIGYFQTSLSLKQDDDVKYQLAKAYFSKGDGDAALEILPVNSKSFYIEQLKSDIFAKRGDFTKANEILLKTIRYNRKDFLYQRISQNYIGLSDADKAVKYALLAIQSGKRNHKNYFVCGQAYYAMCNFKTAINYFEQARTKKQQAFGVDYAEALQEIDRIMAEADGSPTDITTESTIVPKSTNGNKQGVVKTYNSDRGFGFIKENTSDQDFFFHFRQYEGGNVTPQVGVVVTFETEHTNKGEQAKNIYRKN